MSSKDITPLRNNLVIEPHKMHNDSGIVFTDEEKVERATVLAVGPDVVGIVPGDTIYYKNYALDTIVDGETTYTLIEDTEVKALLCTTAPTE